MDSLSGVVGLGSCGTIWVQLGKCRSSRYVEFGREATAAQRVWQVLLHMTHVWDWSGGLAPREAAD